MQDFAVTTNYRFEDFTEDGYRAALALACAYWSFESFGTATTTPHVLWRHDIDVSPHRALRLAEIEHERGVKATYFFLLHSDFYNCLEPAVRDAMRRIARHGHDIGLHFDVTFYPEIDGLEALERRITFEAAVIGDLAAQAPVAVSFHNPTPQQLERYDQPRLAGLVNAYGHPLRTGYRYVSDSNGYWRFQRLHDVLAERANPSLHVLTHPEWWTPECRSPRDRIVRAIEGRAARVLQVYDAFLKAQGRDNVR
jgi:hypothetical protein